MAIPFRIFDKNRENYIIADNIWDGTNWVPINVRNTVYTSLLSFTDNRDNFGRPSVRWQFKNNTIGVFPSDPILVKQNSVERVDIYREAGLNNTITTARIFLDSQNPTTTGVTIDTTNAKVFDSRGVDIEVYKVGDQIDIIVINTFIGEVVKVNDADEFFKRSIDVKIFRGGGDPSFTLEKFETTNFAKDDIVLVQRTTHGTPAIRNVEKAVPQTNVAIGSFVLDNNVIFGGTQRQYSANFSRTVGDRVGDGFGWVGAPYQFGGNTYDFYLDAHGNILANKQHATGVVPLNFAYIADVDLRVGSGVGLQVQQQPRAVANLIYMDGTMKTVNLRIQTAGNNAGNYVGGEAVASGDQFINFPLADGTAQRYYIGGRAEGAAQPADLADNPGLGAILKGSLVSYTVGDNDVVNLSRNLTFGSSPATTAQLYINTQLTFRANNPSVTGVANAFANASTQLVTRAANGTVTTYDGFANFPGGSGGFSNPEVESVRVPVVTVRTGTTLNVALVINGAVVAPPPSVEAYAVWTGGVRVTGDGNEHHLFLSDGSGSGWYRLHDDGHKGPEKDTLYTIKRQSGQIILEDPANLTPATISRVDAAGYFVYDSGTKNTPLFAANMVIIDVRDGGFVLAGVGALAQNRVVDYVTGGDPTRVVAILITG
jgi:hypothetical protein